jgi:REP element-mobilizing transposase RayT
MPFVKVYIHFVWSTKCRYPFLDSQSLRTKVWKHIKENALHKGISINFINGYADHCHCLVALQSHQTIQKIMQMIKGESSYWINANNLTAEKFEWQREYYAASVSAADLPDVRNYIRNQEEWHGKLNLEQEFDAQLKRYGFEKFEG